MSHPSYELEDLLYLMARLRDPHSGCPWDLKQHWQSIVPHTLEEAYEVVEAIEAQDWAHVAEELGDLLFQVVYYARFAQEEGRFDFAQILQGLVEKLLRRHPHVFPNGQLTDQAEAGGLDEAEVKARWEAIKAQERAQKQADQSVSVLAGVPLHLPAMTRAVKLQKRAAQVGFDWDQADQVLDKLEEELGEIREALAQGKQQAVAEEVGDLLFACANLARHLKVDPEAAVRQTNRKFERRFHWIEAQCEQQNRSMTGPDAPDLATMEAWWQAAKQQEG